MNNLRKASITGVTVCAVLAGVVATPGVAFAQETSTPSSSESAAPSESTSPSESAAPDSGNATRASGAITAASLMSERASDSRTDQKEIPRNIIDGSQAALKDGYIAAASPFYLVKKLAAAAANGSSLAKEGNAEYYRDTVAELSNARPGWEMMVPSKALRLSNVEADQYERAAAKAVATRYTQLASDPNVKQVGPAAKTRKVTTRTTDSSGNGGNGGNDNGGNGGSGCVIALDPGHNPTTISDVDEKTKVLMKDYPNGAEAADVMNVANKVKTELEGKGYKVVLLKKTVEESINYRDRIKRAKEAGAKLALSIHTTPGASGSEVFPQRLNGWRSPPGDPSGKVVFKNAETASASEKASDTIAKARSEVEGRDVPVKDNNFTGRSGLWDGNLPVISLLSEKVPWVYNEYGGTSGGGANPISPAEIDKYAKGLATGVERAVKCDTPPAGNGEGNNGPEASSASTTSPRAPSTSASQAPDAPATTSTRSPLR